MKAIQANTIATERIIPCFDERLTTYLSKDELYIILMLLYSDIELFYTLLQEGKGSRERVTFGLEIGCYIGFCLHSSLPYIHVTIHTSSHW
jgi:hypothetical protein